MFQRLKGNETGQSIVVIALAMVAIIAMAALVLDGGYAFLERRRVQNAADAAALAGVRSLATGASETGIRQAIDDYAVRNGITSPSTNVKAYFVDAGNKIVPSTAQQVGHNGQVPSAAVGIVVRAGEQHNAFFAQVIGFPTIDVSAVGQAAYAAAGSAPRLLPIAVVSQTLTVGQNYILWDSNWLTETTDTEWGDWTQGGAKSHRGWLNFDGGSPNASELKNWVCNGYDMDNPVPLWINGSPGVKASVVADANSCNENQVVFVPIFDVWTSKKGPPKNIPPPYPYPGNEQRDYRVVAFAAFRVNPDPAKKTITGNFVTWVAANDLGGSVNYGAVTIKLTPPVDVP